MEATTAALVLMHDSVCSLLAPPVAWFRRSWLLMVHLSSPPLAVKTVLATRVTHDEDGAPGCPVLTPNYSRSRRTLGSALEHYQVAWVVGLGHLGRQPWSLYSHHPSPIV